MKKLLLTSILLASVSFSASADIFVGAGFSSGGDSSTIFVGNSYTGNTIRAGLTADTAVTGKKEARAGIPLGTPYIEGDGNISTYLDVIFHIAPVGIRGNVYGYVGVQKNINHNAKDITDILDSSIDARFGIGGEYSISRNISVSAERQYVRTSSTHGQTMLIGIWKF